jgi:ketosteroid isomerase-like protein
MSAASIERLQFLLDASNAHDLDLIMSCFDESCILELPRGPYPWGSRFEGKEAARTGLAARFAGIPDLRYDDVTHHVCGPVGISRWTLRGTYVEGQPIEVQGCDFYTFRGDLVVFQDCYWKNVERLWP